MTFAPQTLKDLASYWQEQGGTALGIVGDGDHATLGVSYHLGADQLQPGAYSARLPRDVAGLTDAASAIDLGKLDGKYELLRDFSRWLVRRCQADAPGSHDVREVIYSPDGETVARWSGVDGKVHTGPGNGDSSHRFHTHISYFRDSEHRAKLELVRPYFEEVEMAGPEVRKLQPFVALATVKGDGHSAIAANDGHLIGLPNGSEKNVAAVGVLLVDWPGHPDGRVLLVGDEPAWLLWEDVTLSDIGHAVTVDGVPYKPGP